MPCSVSDAALSFSPEQLANNDGIASYYFCSVETLQENGNSLIEQLASGAAGITPRLEAELAFALDAINKLSNDLPAPSAWWKTQTKLPHAAAEKHLPLGVVKIEANAYRKLRSIRLNVVKIN